MLPASEIAHHLWRPLIKNQCWWLAIGVQREPVESKMNLNPKIPSNFSVVSISFPKITKISIPIKLIFPKIK